MFNSIQVSPETALRFYEGDTQWETPMFPKDYWYDPKMYNSLNCLLSPNPEDGYNRVKEGKLLNPEIVRNLCQTLDICKGLYKCTVENPTPDSGYHTYRVDRVSSIEEVISRHATVTFTSSSKNGFLEEYADKIDIGLMEFTIPKGIPVIDLGAVLTNYLKSHEAEVLLMPFITLDIQKRELTDAELKIRDQNGNPPHFAIMVTATGVDINVPTVRALENSRLSLLLNGDKMAQFYAKINRGERLSDEETLSYQNIKNHFRELTNSHFDTYWNMLMMFGV